MGTDADPQVRRPRTRWGAAHHAPPRRPTEPLGWKIRTPRVDALAITRPRITQAISGALRDACILTVTGPAGAGKTTGARQYLEWRGRSHAWFTACHRDDTPARFAAYLIAAALRADGAAALSARRALDTGAAPEDSAAALAEALPSHVVFVLDDVHHCCDRSPVARVLRAFLEALPDGGARVVLLSRRSLAGLGLARHVLSGRVADLDPRVLDLTVDEVRQVLRRRGIRRDAAEVHAASWGWAAAVAFARCDGRDAEQTAVSEDPFAAYLESEILAVLPPQLADDLVRSSLLDAVTPERLAALLGVGASSSLQGALRRHRLPITEDPEGLRYTPLLRDFLRRRLQGDLSRELPGLRRRYGDRLVAEGRLDEAVDQFLESDDPCRAQGVVAEALPTVMRRRDFATVVRWCTALEDELLAARPELRSAQLGALIDRQDYDAIARVLATMRATGEFERVSASAPAVACMALWPLQVSGDWTGVLELLPDAEDDATTVAMRQVCLTGTSETAPSAVPDPGAMGSSDRFLTALESALLYRGRFDDVERLRSLLTVDDPITDAFADLWVAIGLAVKGQTGAARALLTSIGGHLRRARHAEFRHWAEAEVAFAEGRRQEAVRVMREAIATAAERGNVVAQRGILAPILGRMLVCCGRWAEAIPLLEATRRWTEARRLRCFREWADTWLAAALLVRGDPPRRAGELLTEAIRGMRAADRRRELPAALALLAEARWRSGDDAGHDEAATAAYLESEALRSFLPLLQTFEVVPDVLARSIDAEPAGERAWKNLGWATIADGEGGGRDARVVIGTFGELRMDVDGSPADVTPRRALELAVLLARSGPSGRRRDEFVSTLLAGSTEPANYLRQLVHRLRRALPEGVALEARDGRLMWRPVGAVVTEEEQVRVLLERARRHVGDDRLHTLEAASAILDRGAPVAIGDEAERAPGDVEAIRGEVALEHARSLLAEGHAAEAVDRCRRALEASPYLEEAWRVLMRATAVASGPDAVAAVFAEYQTALAEIDLAPRPDARALLEGLRGMRGEAPAGAGAADRRRRPMPR